MTIVLHNGTAGFQISRAGWGELLELGRRHGWQPAGAEPPQWNDPYLAAAYADQNGIYTSVNDADARALAAALDHAVPDIPDKKPTRADTSPLFEAGLKDAQPSTAILAHPNSSLDPHNGFASQDRAQVIEFVAFARQGRFSILSGSSMAVEEPSPVTPPEAGNAGK
jgi:hypothetical protein